MKRSPINYMGGKYRSLGYIIPNIPNEINTFYDIFSGSGTVPLNVKASSYVLNDTVTPLTSLHEYLITSGYEDVYNNLLQDIEEHSLEDVSGEGYYSLRNKYNEDKDPRKLYALIQYSFNYLMRFNKKGEFNASFGKGVCKLGGNALDKLIGYTRHFNERNTKVFNKDFRELLNTAVFKEGDFVYLDPPYEQTQANYNENRGFTGWSLDDALEVRRWIEKLDNEGVHFGYSNTFLSKGVENTDLIHFVEENGFKVYSKEVNLYGVPSNRDYKGRDIEVFITNVGKE